MHRRTRHDRGSHRSLSKIGTVLAARMPAVLDAAIALLESVAPALDAAHPQRYEIERKIGEGGEAEVLLGTVRGPSGFHRLVAVKRVRSGQASADRSAARLLQEARLASRFSHPNVVSVLDYDRDKAGQPFLVMEYVDGVSLEKLVETGPVPRPVAIFIVRELLSGLGYIHQLRGRGGVRGLVHRDVSPPKRRACRRSSRRARGCSSGGRGTSPRRSRAGWDPRSG